MIDYVKIKKKPQLKHDPVSGGGGGAQCGTKWRPGYCLIDQSLMTSSRLGPFYRYDNAELVHVVVQSILTTVITKVILGILIFLTQDSISQEQSRNIYR